MRNELFVFNKIPTNLALMIYFFYFLIIVITFIGMEFIAWSLHKYVMHGFLWHLHEDHHRPHDKVFEKNDLFALVFGIPSWLFMMFGIMHGCDYKLYIGIGIALYGVSYVLIHDGLIHGRFKVFRNPKSKYLIALRRGHFAHHKPRWKKNERLPNHSCYGMLWVPMKFFKEVWEEEAVKKASKM